VHPPVVLATGEAGTGESLNPEVQDQHGQHGETLHQINK
jgi:hypothetical protein